MTAALAGLVVACSLEVDESQLSGRESVTLFEGARLIVGDGSTPVENSAFLVEGTRFTSVGRAGEIEAPDDALRIDLTGKTVIPTFVDIHSHIGYERVSENTQSKENYTRENLIDHLERYAYTGHAITVSLGSDPPEDWVWQMREDSDRPSFGGARFETVGRGLAWPGTGPAVAARNDTPYAVFTPWMAEVAVRELAGHDVPFVKLWVEDRDGFQVPGRKGPFVLTPDISKAAVAEADRHGLRTMAHVKTVAELKDLLRAGVDMWTHPIADAPADEELLSLLRERPGLWYVPVLTPASRRRGGAAGGRRATGLARRSTSAGDQVSRVPRQLGPAVRERRVGVVFHGRNRRRKREDLLRGGGAFRPGEPRRRGEPDPGMGKPYGAGVFRKMARDDAPRSHRDGDQRGRRAAGAQRPRLRGGGKVGGLRRAGCQSSGRHPQYPEDLPGLPQRRRGRPARVAGPLGGPVRCLSRILTVATKRTATQ